MADLVNLNRVRKGRAKVASEAEAAQNRVRFGRTNAEKSQGQAERAKAARDLDGARREDG